MFNSRKRKARKAQEANEVFRDNDQKYRAAALRDGTGSPAAIHFGDQAKKALQEEQRLRESSKRRNK
jgi:hypothetical protein